MINNSSVCIIGDGGWGTTLGILLSKKGHSVSIWGAFPDYVEVLKSKRENVKFLPGVKIPDGIKLTGSIGDAVSGKDVIVFASPSQFARGVLTILKMENLSDKRIISVTKGIENDTLKRVSEIIYDVLGKRDITVMSGPTIALEVANGSPTTVVAASNSLQAAGDALLRRREKPSVPRMFLNARSPLSPV